MAVGRPHGTLAGRISCGHSPIGPHLRVAIRTAGGTSPGGVARTPDPAPFCPPCPTYCARVLLAIRLGTRSALLLYILPDVLPLALYPAR